MKEVYRSNDPVSLSWAWAMLTGAGIEAVLLDGHTSAVYGGAVIERRLVVKDAYILPATRVIEDAGRMLNLT